MKPRKLDACHAMPEGNAASSPMRRARTPGASPASRSSPTSRDAGTTFVAWRTHLADVKRPHPDAALAAACLLGLALLAAAHTWTLPTPVAAEDAPAHEGARVVLEARVLEARHGARGRYLLLADDTARLPALGPPGEGPAVGDVVRIEGIVARDGDGGPLLSFERVVTSARAASTVRSPADVAAAPDLHGGNPLRLEGLVRDGRLHGGGASLALAGAPPPPDATDRVEAVGRLRYQPRLAAYVLVVDAWTLPSRS